jgi:hypothetical protein
MPGIFKKKTYMRYLRFPSALIATKYGQIMPKNFGLQDYLILEDFTNLIPI